MLRSSLSTLVRRTSNVARRTSNVVRRTAAATTASSSTTKESSIDTTRVGFIGLGNMGMPMALNLVREDAHVVAFDVDAQARKIAQDAGMLISPSATDLAAQGDVQVIFTMLPGCDAVNETMKELIQGTPSSASTRTIIDCSTVSPSTSRYWHEAWKKKGHVMLDAPVSGGVQGATDGTLTFMVGCENEDDLERARPFLQVLGQRILDTGGPSTGAATKLCNNLALASQMLGIVEAMNLGEALKVDPVILADVLNKSTAKCWSCEVNNPHPQVAAAKHGHASRGPPPPAARDYQGGFATSLMLKDLGLAVAAAQETGVAMPMTATAKELYRMTQAHGLGAKDFGVMLQFLKGKSNDKES